MKYKDKISVVIPHHLSNLDFINEWFREFVNEEIKLIIVEDKPERQTTIPDWVKYKNTAIYSHKEIDAELGVNSWIIPRGTSAIRSFGLYKAWKEESDIIITIDNDCYPDRNKNYFIKGHLKALNSNATLGWVDSTPKGFLEKGTMPRGYPYNIRESNPIGLNHGLWSRVPDYDAACMLLHPKYRTKPVSSNISLVMAQHNFYPMCGMNIAFKHKVAPLMYFGLFGKEYGFDHFDDIWCGIFSKKIMDHIGYAVRSGYPSIEHRKQSNAFVNFQKQAGGIGWNECIWKAAQEVKLSDETDVKILYKELIEKIKFPDNDYFKKVKKATLLWLELF